MDHIPRRSNRSRYTQEDWQEFERLHWSIQVRDAISERRRGFDHLYKSKTKKAKEGDCHIDRQSDRPTVAIGITIGGTERISCLIEHPSLGGAIRGRNRIR